MQSQRTLRRPVSCSGIGLHSGNKVTLSLKPAPADYGIRFQRADLGGLEVPATVTHIGGSQLQTGLTREAVSVETVEHLLKTEQPFGRQLWGMLSLELWFRAFVDGEQIAHSTDLSQSILSGQSSVVSQTDD